MLSSLLPGFRSLRSAFLTGSLLLGSLFVLIRGNNDNPFKLRQSAEQLLGLWHFMPLTFAIGACFLIGSLYVTALEGIVDRIHRDLAQVDPLLVTNRLKRRLLRILVPFSDAARSRLGITEDWYVSIVCTGDDLSDPLKSP